MADSTLVALKGVVAKLYADNTLTAITTPSPDTIALKGVYTAVPQPAAFPYALVEIQSVPWSQDDLSAMEHKITVHGFSRKESPSEAMAICAAAYGALDRQESGISIDSGVVLLCIFDGVKTTFREGDGVTWHSVIEFKLIIE